MKIPAQQNGNPLAACYCSQLDKALSEVNYAKPSENAVAPPAAVPSLRAYS